MQYFHNPYIYIYCGDVEPSIAVFCYFWLSVDYSSFIHGNTYNTLKLKKKKCWAIINEKSAIIWCQTYSEQALTIQPHQHYKWFLTEKSTAMSVWINLLHFQLLSWLVCLREHSQHFHWIEHYGKYVVLAPWTIHDTPLPACLSHTTVAIADQHETKSESENNVFEIRQQGSW